MSRLAKLTLVAAVVIFVGLLLIPGGSTPVQPQLPKFGAPVTHSRIVAAQKAAHSDCPVNKLHHDMGDCAPPSQKAQPKLLLPPRTSAGGAKGPDLSNNDPAYDQAAIRRHGHRYEWLKLTEGTGFVDRTAALMARNAKRAHILVGGYLFSHVCLVSWRAEGYLFVLRVRALRLTGHNAARPILDVEYGGCSTQSATRAWIAHERAYVAHALHVRVGIYSGNWWLEPHTGCLFASLPKGVLAWISGYPFASPPCGHPLDVHQFSDHYFNGANYGDMNRLVHASLADLRARVKTVDPHLAPPRAKRNCAALVDRRRRHATGPKRRKLADYFYGGRGRSHRRGHRLHEHGHVFFTCKRSAKRWLVR